ncbi:(2Fe-2S)-binding protein, partial [Pseudomonas aeruginosa]|nr:(2Fe-2S)-binding protein [Pseudomonas aeruginosa]
MSNPEPADLPISLLINGQRGELRVPPWLTLLDLLRARVVL